MKLVRGILEIHAVGRRGAMLSGRSMGYDTFRCQANKMVGGKEHPRYEPCGEEMEWSRKLQRFICPIHGEMH